MARTVGLTFEEVEKLKEPEKFKCPHCEKESANLEQLNKHTSEKHPKV